jgi:hypothetical protein
MADVFRSLSIVIVFLCQSFLSSPVELQDTIMHIFVTSGTGYLLYLLSLLYSISPILAAAPILLIALTVHFFIFSNRQNYNEALTNVVPVSTIESIKTNTLHDTRKQSIRRGLGIVKNIISPSSYSLSDSSQSSNYSEISTGGSFTVDEEKTEYSEENDKFAASETNSNYASKSASTTYSQSDDNYLTDGGSVHNSFGNSETSFYRSSQRSDDSEYYLSGGKNVYNSASENYICNNNE